jgi:hypothetical protein
MENENLAWLGSAFSLLDAFALLSAEIHIAHTQGLNDGPVRDRSNSDTFACFVLFTYTQKHHPAYDSHQGLRARTRTCGISCFNTAIAGAALKGTWNFEGPAVSLSSCSANSLRKP